ncbi:MAG: type IV secretion system DNA-binding domain-containing protein, partial [Candidatus Magasanikbacteria bacterium]
MPTHHLQKAGQKEEVQEDVCLFGQTNYRNQMRRFGIKTDDRRRHMYVVGKTGMGKTTMMENMVLQDIYKGHGIGVVDPHGDFAEKIINYIPSNRVNDVVYFNPADINFPIGFNILEVESEEQKHLVASGLMAVFKKIWPDVWSSRMEYILNNTILALLDYPGSTLLGINRLLGDKKYRKKVVRKLTDPVIKAFWQNEFAQYNERYATEAVAPIQNKIGQFLSASVIRNMVAQVKSTINVREIMDSKKILIMNLSKGRIGEDNSRLLGGMLITEIQLAAMARVDTPEAERKDFFLYVDEFQNFATPSFANILSEARKYRLSLIMAHQYVAQIDELVADAVFGNVGTIVTFRVGGADAEFLVKEFTPTFLEEDIVNLPKFQIFLKLMINGVASQPFSAATMPPIGSATGSFDKVVRVSRERYAKPRSSIEEKINRWSGLDGDPDDDDEGNGGGQGQQEKKKPNYQPQGQKPQQQKRFEPKKDEKKDISPSDLTPTKPQPLGSGQSYAGGDSQNKKKKRR